MLAFQSADGRHMVRVATAARWLNKYTRTIRWYIETGKLPAVRSGKLWFIAMDAVKAFRPRCQPRRKVA
jgi:excisionase family DNA binding protein